MNTNNSPSSKNIFCPQCGRELPPKANFCDRCGTPIQPQSIPSLSESAPPQKGRKKALIIAIIIIAPLILLASTFIILTSSHIICIQHHWEMATCTSPERCSYCDKTNGEALGHKWSDATCTTAQKCRKCKQTRGKPLGHAKGEWTITKEATLIDVGVEELLCTACSQSLDSRGTERKDAKVVGKSFNFTDDEFIKWINKLSTASVGNSDLGLSGLSSDNTSYKVTTSDGDSGAIILNHDTNGNIRAIMVYFEDWKQAAALAIWIGEKIDSDFSSDDALTPIVYDESYSAANMTVMRLSLDYDFEVAVLGATSYFESIS